MLLQTNGLYVYQSPLALPLHLMPKLKAAWQEALGRIGVRAAFDFGPPPGSVLRATNVSYDRQIVTFVIHELAKHGNWRNAPEMPAYELFREEEILFRVPFVHLRNMNLELCRYQLDCVWSGC